jgi:4-amino-4-deoxy-L-arabinose transferase-like glycosyltransferase
LAKTAVKRRRLCWYHSGVRQLVRQNLRFFLWATLAALALRLLFIYRFPAVTADSFIYGDIAKNWLQHGIYGVTDAPHVIPTFIRLPGYPAFLAAVFAVFGMEHYRTALLIQVLVDLGTCFLTADLARRLISDRAAKAAYLLTALCPFLANYAAAALSETWEIFFTALALDLAVTALLGEKAGNRVWIGCGLAIAAAILLRPDGGLLLAAVEGYLLFRFLRARLRGAPPRFRLLRAGTIVGVFALAPLIPWTLRNFHTLHRFQPLAPRYANEENEFVPMGFNRWTKTWIADYVSVEEVYWAVPGSKIDADNLPARAFDSPEQQEQTEELLDDYNQALHMTPTLDARFEALAEERIAHSRLRYYVWLPLVRIADMWLRPRTGLLPSDTRWWEFDDDPKWSALAVGLGVINLLYVGLAAAGVIRARISCELWLLLAFLLVRSAFLGTLENPEPRYTLECYPTIVLLICLVFIHQSRGLLQEFG